MKPEIPCANHPDSEGFHQCRYCGKKYCRRCVKIEPGFYRCRAPSCVRAYKAEKAGIKRPCPYCGLSNPRGFPFCGACGEKQPALGERNPETLVSVAEFGHSIEAQLARTKLQSQNIQAFVLDENFISLMPVYDIALGGIKLKVKGSDFDRASKILGPKKRGNFWAPNHVFFITYGLGEYFLWILLIPLGLLIYFIKKYLLGFIDENLFLCDPYLLLVFNAITFSVFCFAYSERLRKSNSSWLNKWSRSYNGQTKLLNSIMALGAFSFSLAIGLILGRKSFWYSASFLFWCFISILLWRLFFGFISITFFSKLMNRKRGSGWTFFAGP